MSIDVLAVLDAEIACKRIAVANGYSSGEALTETEETRDAVAELVERLRASNWRLENLLAMMPAGRPERADIERDLADNRAALVRVGGAS